LSTTEAMINVAAQFIKLNISKKEETFTFKPKGTKKCNQVMVTIRPKRNAMTLDKKTSAAKNFSMIFSRCVKNATPVVTRSPVAPMN
jgi:protoporphyrinogen oxidase